MRLVHVHSLKCIERGHGCYCCRVSTSSSNGVNSAGSRLPHKLEGDERLKNIEPRMVELIINEVCDTIGICYTQNS